MKNKKTNKTSPKKPKRCQYTVPPKWIDPLEPEEIIDEVDSSEEEPEIIYYDETKDVSDFIC